MLRREPVPRLCCSLVLALNAILALVGAGAADDSKQQRGSPKLVRLRGEVVDAATGQLLPCRIYIQAGDGSWFFPHSEATAGSAIPYRKQRADDPNCVEMHTTLSAHPFVVELPPGKYSVTVERGKEYLPQTYQVTMASEPVSANFALRRWINLAERGWYSGETHVHRSMEELPNLMLAEDLNVAFPLVYWVTEAFVSPKTSPRGPLRELDAKIIPIDATHVIYPRNTEYEIFTVNKARHTLGAFFVLNHQSILDEGVPPVRPIGERAHREGGLIELDKHNWPWSMALVPILKPDLYELANNHVWRAPFGFPAFGEPAAEYMRVERTDKGFTERGWIEYGFQNYYTLLNCGYRLRPTAGTASGVHPVPLGFGRVYVHCPKGFGYEAWVHGLNEGRSFVTTGPMLFVNVNGQPPGHTFQQREPDPKEYEVTGSILSEQPLERIELVVNGELIRTIKPGNRRTDREAYESHIAESVSVRSSSWLALRCFEGRPDKRVRFAHSSPVHIDVSGKPLRPRREEVGYLIQRVEEQIQRSAAVLPPAALAEYREALRAYQVISKTAR
jgi:hypothetical protein